MEDKALSEGYVKLYRSLLHHPVFRNREAYHLFSYCLLKANHKAGTVIFGRQPISIERGQFIFGLERASSDLNMSPWKVRSSLDLLISLEMVARKTTTKYSIITICNYSYYQDSQMGKPQTNHKQTTTNNNDKNEKNLLKIECNDFERLSAFLSSLPEYQAFSLEARELVLEFLNRVRASNKTKTIQGGRVCELVGLFRDIQDRTDPESLLVGLKKAFRKMERDGFDFKKRNPTGYVYAVARSHRAETARDKLLTKSLREGVALRNAEGGKVFQELNSLIKSKEVKTHEEKAKTSVPLQGGYPYPGQAD